LAEIGKGLGSEGGRGRARLTVRGRRARLAARGRCPTPHQRGRLGRGELRRPSSPSRKGSSPSCITAASSRATGPRCAGLMAIASIWTGSVLEVVQIPAIVAGGWRAAARGWWSPQRPTPGASRSARRRRTSWLRWCREPAGCHQL